MTPIQKLQTILEGILGQAPTNQQSLKVANAFLDSLMDSEILAMFEKPREEVTSNEKARLVVTAVRKLIKDVVGQAPVNVKNRETVVLGDVSDL